MAIEYYFEIESFSVESFPPWPCPRCGRHSLSIKPGSLSEAETRESREYHRRDDWDPEWISEAFVCLLVCQHPHCGEVGTVAGTTSYRLMETGPDDMEPAKYLEPHFIEPAPEIFRIPRECPKDIAVEIRAAFSLFWNDPGAALNRIRTSLEAFLDLKGVQKKYRTKKGDLRALSLHQRIEKFLPKDLSTRTKMLAVKSLGNVGSHQGGVTRAQVLEAFELAENILEILVVKRPQRLERMARDIIKRKGRPPKPPF